MGREGKERAGEAGIVTEIWLCLGEGGRKEGRRRGKTAVVPSEDADKKYKKSMGPAQ